MPVMLKEFAKRQLKELYKDNITLPQCLILEFIHREGELKMTDLANSMGVTTAAMTGIIDRLVRDGYIARNFDPQDRRVIKVKLTTKANTLVKRINQQKRQMVIKIFGKISASDRQDYLRIVTQIKDMLIKENA
jgi:DNA-binding MarR family transcriptional regulator